MLPGISGICGRGLASAGGLELIDILANSGVTSGVGGGFYKITPELSAHEEGDLVLLVVAMFGGQLLLDPAGWELVVSHAETVDSVDIQTYSFWQIAPAGGLGSFQDIEYENMGGFGDVFASSCVTIRGAAETNAVDGSGADGDGNTNPTAPSATVTAGDRITVCTCIVNDNVALGADGWPGDEEGEAYVHSSNNRAVHTGWKIESLSAGSHTPGAWTIFLASGVAASLTTHVIKAA